jgi:ribosomal protein S18 acetylase RimI-like enzyme
VSGSPDADRVAVRSATAGDAEAIAQVHVDSWRAAYRGVVPDPILDGLSVERRTQFWREAIATEPDSPKWVVERDGRVAGFAAGGVARDEDVAAGTGEIYSIYLDPDAWSLGLGRRLFAAAVDDVRRRGFGPLVLWVLTGNARARRFYEAAGWAPDGSSRILDFDGTPIEEIRYRLAEGRPPGTNGPPGSPTLGG